MRKIAGFLLLLGLFPGAFAQNAPQAPAPQNNLKTTKLPPPSYPPMALAAYVFGDVELNITLRRDGAVDSVEVISGPPMLRNLQSKVPGICNLNAEAAPHSQINSGLLSSTN